MFKLFSEIFRHGLIWIASICMKLAGANFTYIDTYKTDGHDVFIKYNLGNHQFEESYTDFLDSHYARFLDTKQLSRLLNDVAEAKSQHKYIEVEQDEENPELFNVSNKQTGITQTYLLSTILNDRHLLEHMSAETLRELINNIIKLSNSGLINITNNEQGKTATKQDFKIIHSNKKNDKES